MGRHANPDIRRAFAEFQDDDTPSKCNKVRCLHCGYVRAKNTTRQIEHLQQCQQYLQSSDLQAQAHAQAQAQAQAQVQATHVTEASTESAPATADASAADAHQAARGTLNGQAPNPNLQVHRRGPNPNKRPRDGPQLSTPRQYSNGPAAGSTSSSSQSFTSHLLTTYHDSFNRAVQRPFLQHAGCGTLASSSLMQWLAQDGHFTRAYVQFIGAVIAKVRLPPQGQQAQFHPQFRVLDLVISAMNNVRRDIGFKEITTSKYGINIPDDPPTPAMKAYVDLFAACSNPSTSLLECLIVMWATEHGMLSSWNFSASYSSSIHPTTDPHVAVLHQALIPNWTAPAFAKFAEVCRGLVDELAAVGEREELDRCEFAFRHICWLQERIWPDVDGGINAAIAVGSASAEEERSRSAPINGGAHHHGGAGANGDSSYESHLSGINEAAATAAAGA